MTHLIIAKKYNASNTIIEIQKGFCYQGNENECEAQRVYSSKGFKDGIHSCEIVLEDLGTKKGDFVCLILAEDQLNKSSASSFASKDLFGSFFTYGTWIEGNSGFKDVKAKDILKLILDCDKKTLSIENIRTGEIFHLKKPEEDSNEPLRFGFFFHDRNNLTFSLKYII